MYQRSGKLKKDLRGKLVGQEVYKDFKAGKAVKVDRAKLDYGTFIIWFGNQYVAKIPAHELPDTVEFKQPT